MVIASCAFSDVVVRSIVDAGCGISVIRAFVDAMCNFCVIVADKLLKFCVADRGSREVLARESRGIIVGVMLSREVVGTMVSLVWRFDSSPGVIRLVVWWSDIGSLTDSDVLYVRFITTSLLDRVLSRGTTVRLGRHIGELEAFGQVVGRESIICVAGVVLSIGVVGTMDRVAGCFDSSPEVIRVVIR